VITGEVNIVRRIGRNCYYELEFMRREVTIRYDEQYCKATSPFPIKDRDKAPQIFELIIGQKYRVEPVNKLKNKKNRGRTCLVRGIQKYTSSCGKSETFKARIIWQDNGRFGFVDPVDLIPCSQ
jgi:hypothetical protein